MLKKNATTVGTEAIRHILEPPQGAHAAISRFLLNKGLNSSQAANLLNVNRSTVKRLTDGGSLTEEMAAKLLFVFDLDPETLFNMEAKAKAYKSKVIAKGLAAP